MACSHFFFFAFINTLCGADLHHFKTVDILLWPSFSDAPKDNVGEPNGEKKLKNKEMYKKGHGVKVEYQALKAESSDHNKENE